MGSKGEHQLLHVTYHLDLSLYVYQISSKYLKGVKELLSAEASPFKVFKGDRKETTQCAARESNHF